MRPSRFLVELIKDFNIPRSAAGRDMQRLSLAERIAVLNAVQNAFFK